MNTPVRGWPTETAAWPDAPKSLLPGTLQAWPKGANRRHSDAERILNQAIAYWDVEAFREGDRWLRNLGTAGDVLDLRLGSSVDPNSNEPQFLQAGSEGYVYLSGVAGNSLQAPDEAALDITGDIDIRVRVALDDWTPSTAYKGLVDRWGAAGFRAYAFLVGGSQNTGRLVFSWSPDGTNTVTAVSTVATDVPDGQVKWVRVTLDADNGASGNDVKFYLSDDGSTWTQLGTTVTTAGTTSIANSTQALFVGKAFTTYDAAGKFYRAIVKDGIDGTTVLDIDCDILTDGSQTSFQARTGQTVTINRSTSGRKSVVVPSTTAKMTPDGVFRRGRSVMLFGTDDYLTPDIPAKQVHGLISLGNNIFDPDSRCPSEYTIIGVARVWPDTVTPWLFLQQGQQASGTSVAPANGYSFGINTGTGSTCSPTLYLRATSPTAATGPSASMGSLLVAAATVQRDNQREQKVCYTNGIAGTINTVNHGPGADNNPNTFVGYTANGGNGMSGEFMALAYFRRALSQSEIQTITDYFTRANAQGDTEIAATDILAGSVFWIDANRSGVS